MPTESFQDIAPRQIDETMAIPPVEMADEQFAQDLAAFNAAVVDHLDRLRQACVDARDSEYFMPRYQRNLRRSKADVSISIDSGGSIDPASEDGHLSMGFTQGWSAQGIRNVGAYMNKALFRNTMRPYILRGRGERFENRSAEKVAYAVADSLLYKGKFKQRGRVVSKEMAKHGTAIVRYEMAQRASWRIEDGEWKERPPELAPLFRIWPLDQVFVTNMDSPFAGDQEGVFWMTPNCTLQRLEQDEALFSGEQFLGGKFRNLEVVRQDVVSNSHYPMSNEDLDSATHNVSSFPRFTLIEFEGILPIVQWVKDGILTPSIAKWFGVEVSESPDPTDDGQMTEWARRLSRIPIWNVAYIAQFNSDGTTAQSGIIKHLLRCEPDKSRVPRNSMFVFRYQLDGMKFLGLSVTDLGHRLEDMADAVRNAQVFTADYNADPARVCDPRVIEDGDIENVMTLLRTKGKGVLARGGTDVTKLVYSLQLPEVFSADSIVAALKSEFEFTTGASAAGRDKAPRTGTLGEIQLNDGKEAMELGEVVLDAAEEIARLVGCIIQDAIHYLGQEGFIVYAERVSGLPASDIIKIFPMIDGLEEELRVEHPMTAWSDPAVLASTIIELRKLFPQDFPDGKKVTNAILEVSGYPHAEDLTSSYAIMTGEDAVRQLKQGNWVEPVPEMDFVDHLTKGMAALQEAIQVAQMEQQQGLPIDDETKNLLTSLPDYLQKTRQLMQMVLQQMAIQQAAMEEENGGNRAMEGSVRRKSGVVEPVGGREKGAAKDDPQPRPQTTAEQGSDVRQAATATLA